MLLPSTGAKCPGAAAGAEQPCDGQCRREMPRCCGRSRAALRTLASHSVNEIDVKKYYWPVRGEGGECRERMVGGVAETGPQGVHSRSMCKLVDQATLLSLVSSHAR